MGLAGPRLDRPSAVGTEGRPRAASQTVAAVVTVALAVTTLVWLGALEALSLLGLSVALIVPGMALLTRTAIGEQVVGHLLFHAGSVAVVATLFAIGQGTASVVVSGLFVSLLGVAATWTNVLARDRLEEATRRATVSYVSVVGWAVVFVAGLALAFGGWNLVAAVLRSSDPAASLFGALAVLLVVGLLVRGAFWALPVEAVAPQPKRETYAARASLAARLGTIVAAAAFLAIVGGGILGQGRIDDLASANPAVGTALGLVTAPPFVVGLSVFGACCGLGTVLGLSARKLAAGLDAGDYDLLAGALAGLVFTVVLVGYVALPLASISPLLSLLVGFALVVPLLAIVLGFLGVAAIDAGIVPPRAAGPALGAVGLLWAGVGTALEPMPALSTFACVAGAMVVWDCSTFGLGLTVELGHRPATRRLELYHGVLSVGLGIAVVLAAVGVDRLRGVAATDVGAWPAVGLAVLGAVLLAVAAHRREA